MGCPLCKADEFTFIGSKNNYEIVSCQECGFIFVNPMPNTAQLEELYDDYRQNSNYLRKIKKKVFTSKHKLKKLRKYLDKSQKQFLDIGCSLGATVEAAHSLGYQAMGIDLDDEALNQARELFPDNTFESVTSHELVKTGSRFDLVYCAEVIEHVPDPHDFVNSLNSLINSNGLLYMTTPDAGHRKVPKDFVSWNRATPPEHIAYFNKTTMKTILEQHGFKVIKFLWSHRANMRVIARKITQTEV